MTRDADPSPDSQSAEPAAAPTGPRRATPRFMVAHPARWVALGFGSGLSPWAPGTVGTAWAWVTFAVLDPWLNDRAWGLLLVAAALLGWWACTRCAQHLRSADPGAIVWDEVLAFWLVLWLWMPASWGEQLLAFALFRFFDAAKPGPVAWADRLFVGKPGSPPGWREGFGILFDDLVAALCTLLVLAFWRTATG